MKKILALSLVSMVALAGVAFAANGFLSKQYQLNNVTDPVAPTLSTEGMPLTGPNGEPITALSVTIIDYNDGGVDDDFIWLANVNAYLYKPTTRYPDGGAGWTRLPEFDFTIDAGTAAGVPIQTTKQRGQTKVFPLTAAGVPLPVAGAGNRIYFGTEDLLGNDAGTPRHTVLIEGRYSFGY